jgi:hypothetical protein
MQGHVRIFVLTIMYVFITLVAPTGDTKAQDDAARPRAALEGSASTLPHSSGEYLGQKWHVDENHLMWWDGKPYVPFGGFGIKPDNEFSLNTYNLWIDFDSCIRNPKYTRKQHKREIDERLQQISAFGGTCIVQFSMALPHLPEGPRPGMEWEEPKGGIDASRLADLKVKQAIFKVWAEFAPVVRNKCVRSIVLWNEINVWRWPDRMTTDEYAKLLGEYVRETKRIVGDLPVCFKVAGTWNAEAVIAGAAVADGLGFDIWFGHPQDAHARQDIKRARRMLESRQKKTSWFFIAEGGRGITEAGSDEAKEAKDYWDNWPPFRSKEEAEGILQAYARAGARGFIYNGPTSDAKSKYRDSYRWLSELKPEICRLMVETKTSVPPEPRRADGASSPARAIAAACSDRRVEQLVGDVLALRVTVEFSDRWNVWLVHFFSGDHRLGFASVSKDAKVLEVGPPETDEQDHNDRRQENSVKTDRGVKPSDRR